MNIQSRLLFFSVHLSTGLSSFKLDQSHFNNTNTHIHTRSHTHSHSPVTSYASCSTLIRPSLSLSPCLSPFLCLSCLFSISFTFWPVLFHPSLPFPSHPTLSPHLCLPISLSPSLSHRSLSISSPPMYCLSPSLHLSSFPHHHRLKSLSLSGHFDRFSPLDPIYYILHLPYFHRTF